MIALRDKDWHWISCNAFKLFQIALQHLTALETWTSRTWLCICPSVEVVIEGLVTLSIDSAWSWVLDVRITLLQIRICRVKVWWCLFWAAVSHVCLAMAAGAHWKASVLVALVVSWMLLENWYDIDVLILASSPDNDPSLRPMFLVCLYGPRTSKISGDAFESRDRSLMEASRHRRMGIQTYRIMFYHIVSMYVYYISCIDMIMWTHSGGHALRPEYVVEMWNRKFKASCWISHSHMREDWDFAEFSIILRIGWI